MRECYPINLLTSENIAPKKGEESSLSTFGGIAVDNAQTGFKSGSRCGTSETDHSHLPVHAVLARRMDGRQPWTALAHPLSSLSADQDPSRGIEKYLGLCPSNLGHPHWTYPTNPANSQRSVASAANGYNTRPIQSHDSTTMSYDTTRRTSTTSSRSM
jgi:hypothetical protein